MYERGFPRGAPSPSRAAGGIRDEAPALRSRLFWGSTVAVAEKFRKAHRVDKQDIDELGHASNVAYLEWVQGVARAHSEAVGYAHARFRELGGVFVVIRHEIDYLRPAFAGDALELTTWVETFGAASSERCTEIARGDTVLARVVTTWAFVDVGEGRPLRIPPAIKEAFGHAERKARRNGGTAVVRNVPAIVGRGAASSVPLEARPFLKWAGSKRQLLAQFQNHLPARYGRFIEPFVGSGALFFHLRPRRALLADNNARLVRTYRGLRDEPERVIALLASYPHERGFYEELRARDVDAEDDAAVAAWMIYLNKTGYNGLYRVNSKNRFNVPFGRYKAPNVCDAPNLRACAAALAGVEIELSDFETAARRARKGDLVYFDPPYVPLSTTSSFTAYTHEGFGDAEQQRLRDVALELKRRGVQVLLSNSAARRVYELYGDDFELVEVQARRSINTRADRRGRITELLIK
jgi:DNA adenine methylase